MNDLESRLKAQEKIINGQERTIGALKKAFNRLTDIITDLSVDLSQLKSKFDDETILDHEPCSVCHGAKKVEVSEYCFVPCSVCQ